MQFNAKWVNTSPSAVFKFHSVSYIRNAAAIHSVRYIRTQEAVAKASKFPLPFKAKNTNILHLDDDILF